MASAAPPLEGPYRVTSSRVALRLAILGVLALALFAVLFLRLWALQVLSGSNYLRAAQSNQVRTVRVQAPRGTIVDRNGRPLVTNTAGTAIVVWPADLPKTYRERRAEMSALSKLAHVPLRDIGAAIRRRGDDPLTPVTVTELVNEAQVAFLKEHQEEFPGVAISQSYLRHYLHGDLAAQILGYVGEVSPQELRTGRKLGYRLGDEIGQTGIEAAYDPYLRGKPGLAKLRVDSLGRPRSDLTIAAQPQAGNSLRLTIDLKLQQATEEALRYGIDRAQRDGHWAARGGSIVALDPRNGDVLALASYPTYDPAVFVTRKDRKKLAPLVNAKAAEQANYPALDRALAGTYPPGSTFKPVTALAAMHDRIVSPYELLPCTGSFTVYRDDGTVAQVFNNWDPFVDQGMDMKTALAASCDTYFYRLGKKFYDLPGSYGHPLQKWAKGFGFGKPTGIDLGPEESGLLPTPEWRTRTYTKAADPCCWEVDQLWKPGDSIQLAIGQKDLLVTPMQMTRFYALIANGGRLVTPHVRLQVEQPNGQPVAVPMPAAPQPTNVDPGALEVVRQGLLEATHSSIGTSTPVFGGFPVAVAGKTGTAEKVVHLPGYPAGHLEDQSWWCGFGPYDSPSIVVCALIENGGHGGTAAAPAALKVFEAYFGKQGTQQGSIYSD